MEITTNAIGHILGPAFWVLFLALIAFYAVRGALSERREVKSVRDLGDSALAPPRTGGRRRQLRLRRGALRGATARRAGTSRGARARAGRA